MADDSMPYDRSVRLLLDRDPAALLTYLVGQPFDPAQVRRAQTELPGLTVRPDTVYEIGEPPFVVHLEFEVEARPQRIHGRLLQYFERLHTAYKRAPTQYVVVLSPRRGVLPGVFQTGGLTLAYHVVHLWQQPARPLLDNSALSPIAMLAHRSDHESAEDRAAAVFGRIESVSDPRLRQQLLFDAAAFGRIILEPPTINELLRRYTTMAIYIEEHPLYQDGLSKGREQGLEQGEIRAATRILTRRFPDISATDIKTITALRHNRIDELIDLAATIDNLDQLRTWLNRTG